MSTLLQLNSSIHGSQGQSSQLADEFVAAWQSSHRRGEVIRRDLSRHPVPHLTAERFAAFLAAPEQRTPEQASAAADSDALIEELQAADVIVIGLPMYNFGVPSTLKAYFDHVARAGITFRYTENGPEGLLRNKRAVIIATRGGQYAGTPADSQTDYVRTFLNFLGIEDVQFVYAEGLAMGDDRQREALTQAQTELKQAA